MSYLPILSLTILLSQKPRVRAIGISGKVRAFILRAMRVAHGARGFRGFRRCLWIWRGGSAMIFGHGIFSSFLVDFAVC